MPVYHSAYVSTEGPEVAGLLMLPLREGPRGPAPIAPEAYSEDKVDLVDEAIDLFRANVLFRSFEVKGPADRVLVYLTLFIQLCLNKCTKCPDRDSAARQLTTLSTGAFSLPGSPGFPAASFFRAAVGMAEQESLRNYLKQLRETTVRRLVARVYLEDGKPNKFWMAFAKRKFMGLELTA